MFSGPPRLREGLKRHHPRFPLILSLVSQATPVYILVTNTIRRSQSFTSDVICNATRSVVHASRSFVEYLWLGYMHPVYKYVRASPW